MRKISFILAGIITLLVFSSCTRDKGIDVSIQEHAAQLSEEYTYYGAEPGDEYYGNFSKEESYTTLQNRDWEGIVNYSRYPSNFKIDNDKLYYFVYKPISDDKTQSYGISAFIDLNTGEQSYLCTDPICTHEYGSDCTAINIPTTQCWNNKIVSISGINRADYLIDLEISLFDIQTGTKDVLAYFSADYSGDEAMLNYNSPFISDDKLYFNIIRSYTDPETKTQTKITENYIYDLLNNTLSDPMTTPEKYQGASPFYFDGEFYYWFVPYYALLTTDANFENESILYDFDGTTPSSCTWSYDTEKHEMLYLVGNKKTQTGTIYLIKNGEVEPLTLPHQNINYFCLTRDKIYYSTYDNAYAIGARAMSQDVFGDTVYEDGGGIVYVTDRESRTEAELFFDNGQTIDLYMQNGWLVLDGNIYMLSMSYRNENTVSFSTRPYQKVIRINPANNTIRYFRFD